MQGDTETGLFWYLEYTQVYSPDAKLIGIHVVFVCGFYSPLNAVHEVGPHTAFIKRARVEALLKEEAVGPLSLEVRCVVYIEAQRYLSIRPTPLDSGRTSNN